MPILYQSKDEYRLELLNQEVQSILSDEVFVDQIELKAYRNELIRATVLQLRGYMLADHLENQTVTYTETLLPRWLKWLERFVTKKVYQLELDAYYTYPESRVAIPDLGKARKVVTFSKALIPENLLA